MVPYIYMELSCETNKSHDQMKTTLGSAALKRRLYILRFDANFINTLFVYCLICLVLLGTRLLVIEYC